MKKRICSLLLWCLLVISVISVPAMAVSGNLEVSKPSRAQLQEKWRQVTQADSVFLVEPSVTAPYAAGALTDSILQSGLSYLNYVRFAAGLPDVQLDATLNEDAQHGAVVLAAVDKLTHYPSKPADMDDAFFRRGYGATTSSNISARYNYPVLGCLQGAVSGCMDDNSSPNNLATMGHRRWLLNPELLNVGFGYAYNAASNWQYITTKVFDRSGKDFDYDYIAWPASGNFPTNLFATNVPWSISLNPQKYQAPAAGQVQITITRQSDGKTWQFFDVNPSPTTASQAYMTIENSWYGIPNCIIFNPGSDNVEDWIGKHTVSVSGIYTADGQPATLNYQVDFFSIDATCPGHSYTATVTAPTCTQDGYTTYTCQCGDSYQGNTVPALGHSYDDWVVEQEATETQNGILVRTCTVCGNAERQETVYGNPFLDVSEDMFYYEPVLWAVKEGITTGTSAFTFTPEGTCTRAQIVTFLWRSAGSPAPEEGRNPFTDVPEGQWYTDAVLWAVEKGITTGTSATTFSPDASCTRGQVATFLWRAKGEPTSSAGNIFTDITPGAYYYDAVLWAVENGITNGMGDGTFAPDAPCTRGQIVTFLYRASNIAPDDGETDEDETLEHTHKYTDTVTKPTCTTDGYTTHKCSCGDSYVDTTVAATGHAWGDWKVVKEATATSDGSKERTCSTCNTKETGIIPNLSHTHSYTSVATNPTCTADGYTTYTCACGDSYVGNKVASTGHSYTHTVTKPTCTAEGYTTHRCSICQNTYTDTKVSAKGHSWGRWVTITEPTETSTGLAKRTCGTCSSIETKTLDKAAHTHNYNTTVEYVAPNCKNDGYARKACSCGETKTEFIPAGDHDWVHHHEDEVGHYEVRIICHCGWSCSAEIDYTSAFIAHVEASDPATRYDHSYFDRAIWVVDVPAKDWEECSGCGITK